jgi:hypothetical protein
LDQKALVLDLSLNVVVTKKGSTLSRTGGGAARADEAGAVTFLSKIKYLNFLITNSEAGLWTS